MVGFPPGYSQVLVVAGRIIMVAGIPQLLLLVPRKKLEKTCSWIHGYFPRHWKIIGIFFPPIEHHVHRWIQVGFPTSPPGRILPLDQPPEGRRLGWGAIQCGATKIAKVIYKSL
jgi:hypothetical protein